MSKWVIKYKEYGKDRIGTCSHSGNKSQEEVIEFFGLNGPDVEWYEITMGNEPLKQTTMKNYGNTINQLYQTLAKKAEGVRICDFKNIDTMVDIYEEDNSTMFFYFNKLLRGAVFDIDTDRPYISKTFHVWNNVYDDWDEVTFEKDIPLKPNEIIIEDNSTPFQIAVLNWDTNTIDVISTSLDPDTDIEIWLEEQGYDMNWCYYTCGETLQFNFKTIKG